MIETESIPLLITLIVELCRYWRAMKRLLDEGKDTIINYLSIEYQDIHGEYSSIHLSLHKFCSARLLDLLVDRH